MEDKLNDIVMRFRRENPRKGNSNSWASKHPAEYQAAKILIKEGYPISRVADHFGTTYNVLMRQLRRDGEWTTKKYCRIHELHSR